MSRNTLIFAKIQINSESSAILLAFTLSQTIQTRGACNIRKAIVSCWNSAIFSPKAIFRQHTQIDSLWIAWIPPFVFPHQQIDRYGSARKSSLGRASNVKTLIKVVELQSMGAGPVLMFRLPDLNQKVRLHLQGQVQTLVLSHVPTLIYLHWLPTALYSKKLGGSVGAEW